MTTTRFQTSKASWKKTMGPVESFSCVVFTRGALYYRGEVDVGRFSRAMQETLSDFDFVLATFEKDEEGRLVAYYPPKNPEVLPVDILEIEKRDESIAAATMDTVLPYKIFSEKNAMRTGFAMEDDLKNNVMGAFKLTIFDEGFTVGYNLNHTIFDQASIYYLMKYLAQVYSLGHQNINLKKPEIVDALVLQKSHHEIPFTGVEQVRAYGDSALGFVYVPLSEQGAAAASFSSVVIKMKFNLEHCELLRKSSKQYISVNDLIHAILLKIFTANPDLKDEDTFILRYAINIRKRCGLGEEVIGNYTHQHLISEGVGKIRSSSLVELAELNRKSVLEISADHFLASISFYKYIQDNKINKMEFIGPANPKTTRTTNWVSFDYDSIAFDQQTPYALKSPSIASYGVDVISFDTNKSGSKIYTCPVSIPSSTFAYTQELSSSSGLFEFETL